MDAAAVTTTTTEKPEQARPRLLAGRHRDIKADDPFFAPTRAGDPGSDLTFGEVLDVINPLQHIPVVSTIYRAITGDTISPTARVAGGMIYGGPIGAAFAAADNVIEGMSGADPGGHMMAALGFGPATADAPAVAVASAGPSGLIAEASTRPPIPAATPPVALVAAAKPEKPPVPAAATATTAAAGIPQLSPAAFDTLIRSIGGQEVADAAPATTATAAAGSTSAPRFFPARHVGTRPPQAVPMDIRPADNAGYDAALRMMRENIERYTGPTPDTTLATP